MPNATTTSEINKAALLLIEAVEAQGHGDEMLIAILREMTDLIRETGPLGRSLSVEQGTITNSLSTSDVAEKLGIDASSIRHRQAKGRLYSFKAGSKRRYPTWQFTDDPAQPVLPGLSMLVNAFPEDLGLASIQNFMGTPKDDLVLSDHRSTPREWLQLGGDVQDVVDSLERFLQS